MFCFCVSCADKLYMGPGQLYQDLQNLIHDLNLVNQISSMISSLKGNYQVVNDASTQSKSLFIWIHFMFMLPCHPGEDVKTMLI